MFVDASGRRSKKLRRVGWGVAVLCAAYAVTLIAALVGGGSTAPLLNIPGVPGLADKGKPAQKVKTDPSASPAASDPVGPTGPVPSVTDADGNLVPNPGTGAADVSDGKPAGHGVAASGAAHSPAGGKTAASSGTAGAGKAGTTGGSTTPRSGGAAAGSPATGGGTGTT
ncbi:hypothetical protein L1885_15660, partial [Streptomyces fuscigenes]|nr:hypothetical protein [Streptomyces fuscigenes]